MAFIETQMKKLAKEMKCAKTDTSAALMSDVLSTTFGSRLASHSSATKLEESSKGLKGLTKMKAALEVDEQTEGEDLLNKGKGEETPKEVTETEDADASDAEKRN